MMLEWAPAGHIYAKRSLYPLVNKSNDFLFEFIIFVFSLDILAW